MTKGLHCVEVLDEEACYRPAAPEGLCLLTMSAP